LKTYFEDKIRNLGAWNTSNNKECNPIHFEKLHHHNKCNLNKCKSTRISMQQYQDQWHKKDSNQ